MGENAKIRIKLGSIEIDYDGPSEFLDSKLAELVATVVELQSSSDVLDDDAGNTDGSMTGQAAGGHANADTSVSTIARRLNVASSRDLLNAAAYTLSLTKPSFARKELLAQMRNAQSYWKASYAGNLTKDFKRAVKAGELNHVGGTTYSLPHPRKTEVERQLAQANP
jgi:hypothetical protein